MGGGINVVPNSQGGSPVSKKVQTSEHFLSKSVVSYRVSFSTKVDFNLQLWLGNLHTFVGIAGLFILIP